MPGAATALAAAAPLVMAVLALQVVDARVQDLPPEGQIGGRCSPSGRCRVYQTECRDGRCLCNASAVPSNNQMRCLTKTSKLKKHCEESVQCLLEHTFCAKDSKVCDCQEGYVQANNRCLPVVGFGDACEYNQQCIDLTQCSPTLKVCVCRGIAFEVNGRCDTDNESPDWEVATANALNSGGAFRIVPSFLASVIFGLAVVDISRWRSWFCLCV